MFVQCRMMLFKVKSVLEDGVEAEDAKAVARTRVSCLEEEIKLLETDLRMLREYIESNHCIDENGKEHNAVHETAFTDLNCQVRPRASAFTTLRRSTKHLHAECKVSQIFWWCVGGPCYGIPLVLKRMLGSSSHGAAASVRPADPH